MTVANRPVPECVLYLAYAALTGEELDWVDWFAIAGVAKLLGLPTREEAVRAVLLKAAANGITRVCRG